jgi:hypothetical protein
MSIAPEEWSKVRSSLANNKMIDVEKLAQPVQRRLAIAVCSMGPRAERGMRSRRPWYYFVVLIFAVESHRMVECGGGCSVRGQSSGPDELFASVSLSQVGQM